MDIEVQPPEQPEREEPLVTIEENGTRITLLGTAHISRASADKVEELLDSGKYDAVAVELCPSRHNAIINPDALAKMDLFEVLRSKKATMVAANLALGAYQQRMADELGIEPGAEMKMAVAKAQQHHLPVLLIDREISVTLKRVYRNVGWWKRINLLSGLMASLMTRQKVTEDEIERLKEGDMLESAFSQFAEQAREIYGPLIDERDRYMTARLRQEVVDDHPRHILAVIGAGHLKGMQGYLEKQPGKAPNETIEQLDTLPPPSRWPKLIPWLIVALILSGFYIGFSRNTALGWQIVIDWVAINGGLAALGAVVARAHPMTTVGAFFAAPLTSLNPTIGAGMVTAAMEVYFRRPNVGDFSQLRKDTASVRGWWKNRVSRTLLVFIFCTIGSAIGTYAAGFLILDRLTGS